MLPARNRWLLDSAASTTLSALGAVPSPVRRTGEAAAHLHHRRRMRCRRARCRRAHLAWLPRPLAARLGKRGARGPRRSHPPSRPSSTAAETGTRTPSTQGPHPHSPLRRQNLHRRRRRPRSRLHRRLARLGLRLGRRSEDDRHPQRQMRARLHGHASLGRRAVEAVAFRQ